MYKTLNKSMFISQLKSSGGLFSTVLLGVAEYNEESERWRARLSIIFASDTCGHFRYQIHFRCQRFCV